MLPHPAENHHTDGKQPQYRRWAAPAILAFLIVGFYWKLVFTTEYTWLQSPDFAYQILPWFQMQASEWHSGRFPMWDPYQWLGQPLFGQAQPGAAYPPNWLFFNLPLRNGWIRQGFLHWYFVVQHVAAALFAYMFVRDLGRSRLAAILSGCVFSLSAWMASTGWPQMVNGAIWAPVIFLFLMRVVRGHRPLLSAAWSGFFLGFAWLSGHHQVPIYMSLACAGVWLYALVMGAEQQQLRRVALLCALFWVIALMAGALQILPAQEYGKLSVRWIGLDEPVGWTEKVPYEIHERYSLSPISLLGIVFPSMYTHSDPFIGVAAFLACLIGVVMGWRMSEVRIFASITVGALLFGFAHHNVFHGMIYSLLPIVEKARTPAMVTVLIGFGASVLAAYGLDLVRNLEKRNLCRILGLGALTFAGIIYMVRVAVMLTKGFDSTGDNRPMMTLTASLLCGGVLLAYSRRAISYTALAVAIIGVFLIEVTNTNGFYLPSRFEKERNRFLAGLPRDADLVDYLRRQSGPVRVAVNDQEVPHNFGDWHGIDTLGGYLASVTANFLQQSPHTARGKQLFGVGFALRKEPDDFYTEVAMTGQSGQKLFVNRTVFPRAFAVHELISLPSRAHVGVYFSDPKIDLRTTSFVVGGAPPLESCAGNESVRVTDYTPNRVSIIAELNCRGMVVLSDTFFPGWHATVDGKPATILEAYGIVRGVVAGAGVHQIEMRYAPASIIAGGILSATSLLLCGGLTFWTRRRAVLAPA